MSEDRLGELVGLYQDVDQGWVQVSPPLPQDEDRYDILLYDGTVAFNVTYWSFGGGFSVDEFAPKRDRMVQYPMDTVIGYRPAKPKQVDQ